MSPAEACVPEDRDYAQLIDRIRTMVGRHLPLDGTVIVVSRGDETLLDLDGRPAWHFPRSEDGTYAGYYPADCDEAIAQLEALRVRGGEYLLFPRTAMWWLDHYPKFRSHLEENYSIAAQQADVGIVFALWESEHARLHPPVPADVQARNAHALTGLAADGFPHPPADLVYLVSWQHDIAALYYSGVLGAEWIRRLLRDAGKGISDFHSILDFGCGCGRVIRQWRSENGPALHGTDINRLLVDWCERSLPFARFSQCGLSSGTRYDDQQFDFIYAMSVFTHLNEQLQAFWMSELQRILKPHGFLLITTHGSDRLFQLTPELRAQFEAGQLVVVRREDSGTNACSAFHPEAYIRDVLAAGLNVVSYRPGGAVDCNQDAVLLQKPGEAE